MLISLRAYVVFCALVLLPSAGVADDVNVSIDSGQLLGEAKNGVVQFKGIPYATPPIGARRWRPPEPPASWTGVRRAVAFSPECVQNPRGSVSVYSRPQEPISEDCLYLNVWSTNVGGETAQPVMIWIHGGALTRGSGSSLWYEGSALANKGVVVVNFNYRLGPLGYMAHADLSKEAGALGGPAVSGNYGTLDQIAALKWVQANIAAFGGDPGNVTIFGESAGSWSVNHMVASPLAKGLFHKAIGQSGGRFGPMPELAHDANGWDSQEKRGAAYAAHLGTDDLDALRSMPAADIMAGYATFKGRDFTRANVDGHVFPKQIVEIFRAGEHNRVTHIVGSTRDEATTLLPRPRDRGTARRLFTTMGGAHVDELMDAYRFENDHVGAYYGIFSDYLFTWQMRQWADLATAAGDDVYLYYFTFAPPWPYGGRLGAYHASEIRYVFDNARITTGTPSKQELALGEAMSDYWVNFAKRGVPSAQGEPAWPKHDPVAPRYLEFGADRAVRKGPIRAEQVELLDAVIGARWDREDI